MHTGSANRNSLRKLCMLVAAAALAALALALLPRAALAGDSYLDCGDRLHASHNSDCTDLLIERDFYDPGPGVMDNYGAVMTPWHEDLATIEVVTIREGVVSIGDNAFEGMTALHTIVLPSTLTGLGAHVLQFSSGPQYVYYAGTEEQWAAFKAGVAGVPGHEQLTDIPTVICCNLGPSSLKVYPQSLANPVTPGDLSALRTSLDALVYNGKASRYENADGMHYDLDDDGTYDIVVALEGVMEEDSSNMLGSSGTWYLMPRDIDYAMDCRSKFYESLHFDFTDKSEPIAMHRLYNPYSGEHFYTANVSERDFLVTIGWVYESVGWYAPQSSLTPVYRMYNPYTSDHHYTTDASERTAMVAAGWSDEGTGWFSDDAKSVPLYRQFNPYVTVGTHNYTTDKAENDYLATIGWIPEGIGWYGVNP